MEVWAGILFWKAFGEMWLRESEVVDICMVWGGWLYTFCRRVDVGVG